MTTMTARSPTSVPRVSSQLSTANDRTQSSIPRLPSHLSTANDRAQTYILRTAAEQYDEQPDLEIEESELNLSQVGSTMSRTDLAGPYVNRLFTNVPGAVRSPSEYMNAELEMRYAGEQGMRDRGIIPQDFVYGDAAVARAKSEREWLERGRRVRPQGIGAQAVISDYQLAELRDAVNQLEMDADDTIKRDEFEQQLARIDEIVRRREELNEAERRWYDGTRTLKTLPSNSRLYTATRGARSVDSSSRMASDAHLYAPRQTPAGTVYRNPEEASKAKPSAPSSVYAAARVPSSAVSRQPVRQPSRQRKGANGSSYLAEPLNEMPMVRRNYVLSPYELKRAAAEAYNAKHNVNVIPYDPQEIARPSLSQYQMDAR